MRWCIAHPAAQMTRRRSRQPGDDDGPASVSGIRCTSPNCGAFIGAGEAYALVSSGDVPKCATCVKRLFDVDPPDSLWSATPVTDLLPTVMRASGHGFVTPRNFAQRAGASIRDGKLAQLGDEK